MRNAFTDNIADQMNAKTPEQIQQAIDNGTFFDCTMRNDYQSMHTVVDGNIVQVYRWNNDSWFAKM